MTSSLPAVLVADDESAQTKALCDILNRNGFSTTGCTSPAQAIELLACNHYDLLLTDLMMPGMDGIALMRTAIAADSSLVVLLMTGAGTITQAIEAMKTGALDVILKPFKVTELLPAVSKALTVRELRVENIKLQKSLHERNAAMERMLAIVAHDLRAPLLGISGCIDLLTERSEVSPNGLPLCQAIRQEAKHLVDLATDLIDVSRISSGQMPWHWDGINPRAVVDEVVAALQAVASTARVQLVIGTISATPVRGDGSACRRLLINLISNAIRHARATTITVSAEPFSDHLRFTVVDNGRGIDPSVGNRLGRPFGTSSGGASPLGGVGLGLAICLGIAEAHGGQIAISSRLGLGTRVTVDLRGDLDHPMPMRSDGEVQLHLDLLGPHEGEFRA
jgi:signal transduction histidine kinase